MGFRHRLTLPDLGATRACALALAPLLEPGDVVVLTGEIGAGKTTFTRDLAAGWGSSEEVVSPTFTIMRHLTRPDGAVLLHLDAYRLTGPSDADDLGLDELLDGGAIAVIEWGEILGDSLGPNMLRLGLTPCSPTCGATSASDSGPGDEIRDEIRVMTVTGSGPRWDARARVVEAAVAPWLAEVVIDDGAGAGSC